MGNKENGRQLREIQENENFEKIRQSTSINAANNSKDTSEGNTILDENDYDDDYYDNDAGLDYDEAFEEGDEEEDMIHQQLDLTPALTSSTPIAGTNIIHGPVTPKHTPNSSHLAKPILKTTEKEMTPLPRKSVRFSLRPAGGPSLTTPIQQPQVLGSNLSPQISQQSQVVGSNLVAAIP